MPIPPETASDRTNNTFVHGSILAFISRNGIGKNLFGRLNTPGTYSLIPRPEFRTVKTKEINQEVDRMEIFIPFEGKSQYDDVIHQKLQGSACGPVTMAAIVQYHEGQEIEINTFYRMLGSTRIGSFKWRLIRRLRWLLGPRYRIEETRKLEEVKKELLAGRPVAMKFDKHFSFRWFQKPTYRYHWVPLIGFRDEPDDVTLFFHDNGGRGRKSKVRGASWNKNRDVLSFIKIIPLPRRS